MPSFYVQYVQNGCVYFTDAGLQEYIAKCTHRAKPMEKSTTNLIHASVDPKTVQYLAGHESSKITMDIYAKVKYNRPDDLVKTMGCAFDLWDAV